MQAILLITVLALGGSDKKDPPKKEPSIAGSWGIVNREREGKNEPDGPDAGWLLKADGSFYLRDGQKLDPKEGGLTYRVDFKATPATFDVCFMKQETPLLRGIFKLDGNKLIVCIADIDEPRPTEFKTKAGSKSTLLEFKRVD